MGKDGQLGHGSLKAVMARSATKTPLSALGFLAGALTLSACAALRPIGSPRDALSPAEHITLGNSYLAHNEKNLAVDQYITIVEGTGKWE